MKRYRVIPHHVNWNTGEAYVFIASMKQNEPILGYDTEVFVPARGTVKIDYVVEKDSLDTLDILSDLGRADRYELLRNLRSVALESVSEELRKRSFFGWLFG